MVLFFTIAYPPNPAAASVVHRLLLDQFSERSYVVVTSKMWGAKKSSFPASKQLKVEVIYHSFEFLSSKIHRVLARFQKWVLPYKVKRVVRKYEPALSIIAYPDLYFLDQISSTLSKEKQPYVVYLHDTIKEGVYDPKQSRLAEKVQNRIFEQSRSIAVMSEGMQDLYQRKYGLNTISWEHVYPEDIQSPAAESVDRVHWSGDIYEINYKGVARVSKVLEKLNYKLTISNGKTREQLSGLGLNGSHVEKVFYPQRSDYLAHLRESKLLLLSLNYPDECNVHEDELATIFSTKTPEYLASQSLIIYHGPSSYFLAKFLTDYDCGVVIDTRSESELFNRLDQIMRDYHLYSKHIENAKKALDRFRPEEVVKKVISQIDADQFK